MFVIVCVVLLLWKLATQAYEIVDTYSEVECPVCNGVCGVNVAEGYEIEEPDGSWHVAEDWHDCDFCNAIGKVTKQRADSYAS